MGWSQLVNMVTLLWSWYRTTHSQSSVIALKASMTGWFAIYHDQSYLGKQLGYREIILEDGWWILHPSWAKVKWPSSNIVWCKRMPCYSYFFGTLYANPTPFFWGLWNHPFFESRHEPTLRTFMKYERPRSVVSIRPKLPLKWFQNKAYKHTLLIKKQKLKLE